MPAGGVWPAELQELAIVATSFAEFEAAARARGFDEVLVREWAPLTELPTHSHPFAVKALVVAGEMWLTVGGQTQHLLPGDSFEIEREVPHAERYGSEGTTFWAARRHATDPARA